MGDKKGWVYSAFSGTVSLRGTRSATPGQWGPMGCQGWGGGKSRGQKWEVVLKVEWWGVDRARLGSGRCPRKTDDAHGQVAWAASPPPPPWVTHESASTLVSTGDCGSESAQEQPPLTSTEGT